MGHRKTLQQQWLDAAMKASQGPEVHIQCPACKVGILRLFDVSPFESSPKLERYFACNTCKAYQVALKPRDPAEEGRFVELVVGEPEETAQSKWQSMLEMYGPPMTSKSH
ncbi:hypothetical protein [Deinococcus misasensis]|uniref:hypothetical protein n=1 Tax=Deinococcus misasensis TaxID=392413 RepID=UPI0005573DCC|nr:hypothetical protein [Deinococcus misasensis]